MPAEQGHATTSYLNIGILLYNKKQAAAAEEAFDKALELTPDLADAYYYRGLARMQLKKNAAAKADLSEVPGARAERGRRRGRQGDLEVDPVTGGTPGPARAGSALLLVFLARSRRLGRRRPAPARPLVFPRARRSS